MGRLYYIAAIAFGLGTTALFAHHPFASEFDANKPVTIKGTIKSIDWIEPHVNFVVTDTSNPGGQDWRFEGASPGTLERREWNSGNRPKVGDTVTVHGFRALDGSIIASARSIEMPDGKVLSISDPSEDGGPAPLATSEQVPTQLPRMGARMPFLILAAVAVVFLAYLMTRTRRSA